MIEHIGSRRKASDFAVHRQWLEKCWTISPMENVDRTILLAYLDVNLNKKITELNWAVMDDGKDQA